jgi:hypothetical protein
MVHVNRRLEVLRRTFGNADPKEDLSPQAQQLERRRAAILQSMAPEHREHIEEIERSYDETMESGGTIRDAVRAMQTSNLHRTFMDLTMSHGPAVLPRHVAEVYLNDPNASPLHDCDTCGYQVPIRPGDSRNPAKSYFERCPLEGCDGATGWYAYYQRHSHHPPDPTLG